MTTTAPETRHAAELVEYVDRVATFTSGNCTIRLPLDEWEALGRPALLVVAYRAWEPL